MAQIANLPCTSSFSLLQKPLSMPPNKNAPAQLEDIELTSSPDTSVPNQEKPTSITLVWSGVHKTVTPPAPPPSLLSGVYGSSGKDAGGGAVEEKEVRILRVMFVEWEWSGSCVLLFFTSLKQQLLNFEFLLDSYEPVWVRLSRPSRRAHGTFWQRQDHSARLPVKPRRHQVGLHHLEQEGGEGEEGSEKRID